VVDEKKIFNSPEPKAQVNRSNHRQSVVWRKLFL